MLSTTFSNRSLRPIQTTSREQILEEIRTSFSESAQPGPGETRYTINDDLSARFGLDGPTRGTSSLAVPKKAIDLYFKYCHRQPIWLFDRDELEDQGDLPDELVLSIQVLASRFSRDRDQWQHYGNNAKRLIMLRVASGTVELATIESLCLLSYSFLIGTKIVLTFSLV